MAKKLTNLTNEDKNKVLSGTSYVLPNNPSNKGWTADQIRQKGYQGILYLFDLLQKSILELNDYIDNNDTNISDLKTRVSSIETQITTINNFVVSLNTDVEKNTSDITKLNDEITTINTSLTQLKEKIDGIVFPEDCATISYVDTQISNLDSSKENVSNKTTTLTSSSTHKQYPSAKVVYDRIQDVREVAEGKSNSYVISYSDVVNQDTDFSTNNYYDMYGYRIENYGEVEKYILISALERPSANNDFNSKNDNLVFEDLNRYIVVESSSLFNSEDINGKVILPLEYFISKLRIGDVINIREVNIPDRWYAGNHSFGALETKIDLTTLVNISDDQEINGIKTFNNNIQVKSSIVGVGSEAKNIGDKNLPFDHLYIKYISDGTNETTLSDLTNGIIKEISTYSIRIWDLDTGVYRLTNPNSCIIYYSGSTNKSNFAFGNGSSGSILIVKYNQSENKKYWNLFYLSSSAYGKTSSTSGEYSSGYPASKIKKVNDSINLIDNGYLPTTPGTSGQVLISNGSGAPTWSSDFYTKTEVDNAINNAIGNVLNGDF